MNTERMATPLSSMSAATPSSRGSDIGVAGPTSPSFPIDVLPDPVRSFVREASAAIGCDVTYVAMPLLSGLAAAVGTSRRIQLKSDWREPCVLWTCTIGPSGTLKSPAQDLALAPLRREQRAAFVHHAQRKKEYDADTLRHDVDLQTWKRKGALAGVAPPEPPTEPTATRITCSDTTVEALAARLQENPRGVLVVRDELSGWFASFDAYNGAHGRDLAHWLEMHRAGELLVDRKTGQPKVIYVPRAAVSITGGITPEVLRKVLRREHLHDGLAARFLFAMPPRRPKKWTDAAIPAALHDAIQSLYRGLRELPGNTDGNDQLEPLDHALTPEAQARWIEFYDGFARRQNEITDGALAAAFSKLEGYAARCALLIHLIRLVTGGTSNEAIPVDADSITAGVALIDWFGQETERIYDLLHETPDERETKRLIDWIATQGGTVSVRDLMRSRWRCRSAKAAKQKLRDLEDAGLGALVHTRPPQSGGRQSLVFQLDAAPDDGECLETDVDEERIDDENNEPDDGHSES